MRYLQIVKHPAKVLTSVASNVTTFDAELKDLAASMLYTIGPVEGKQQRIGVGLAAPQVGKSIRMVVIAAHGFPEMAMVNPVIVDAKGDDLGEEGCLSLPGVRGRVRRFRKITVNYQDLDGKPCTLKAKEFLARVIQHEVDHLDGIEFTDRIREQGGRI